MLRSSKHLQFEVSLRERIEELAAANDDTEAWDEYASRSNRVRLEAARRELARITGRELEWEFAGAGVSDHSIAIKRLGELTVPLGQTLRWISRDILLVEGRPTADVNIAELVEPVVTGTFPGSFGVKVAAPPAMEQMTLEGSVFDRTVDRMVAIFDAAREEDQHAIAELAQGLRTNSLEGLRSLTKALSVAGRPSRIRWRGSEVVTVTTGDAILVNLTLSEVTPHEDSITIQAQLVGADIDTGSFHLLVEGEPRKDYRGKVEEEARLQLRNMPLGRLVNATLTVIEAESPFLPDPKETFILTGVEPANA